MTSLKKYLHHTFDDWGGTTSDDYKTFETKYINYLKRMCKRKEWSFIKANRNHYEFSAVIQRNDGQYVYIAISDVRYWTDQWFTNILVRTMKHENDWTGGFNNHCMLDELESKIEKVR